MGHGEDSEDDAREWEARLDASDRPAFRTALHAAVEHTPATLDTLAGHVTLGRVRVGLEALADSCLDVAPAKYEDVLTAQIAALIQANEDAASMDTRFANLSAIESSLRLRLHRQKDVSSARRIARTISYTESPKGERSADEDDLIAVLVSDEQSRIVTIDSAWTQNWETPLDAVLDRAAAQTAAEDASVDEFSLGPVRFRSLVGDGYYVASHALQLSRFIDPTEYGVLFAVPHRHAVLLHRIEDHHVVDAIEALLPVAEGMFNDGPGSISDELFWWRNGRVLRLPVAREEGGQRKVRLPPSFVSAVLSPIMKDRP
ncbi:MAG: hypothetical protein AAF938_29660 [Myxococcota bacterium]